MANPELNQLRLPEIQAPAGTFFLLRRIAVNEMGGLIELTLKDK